MQSPYSHESPYDKPVEDEDPALSALLALIGTGVLVKTGAASWALRTLTGTTNQINIANGDGVSGNPTFSTPQNIHTAATPQFAGIGLGTAYSSGRIQLISGTTSADGIFWGTDTNLYRDGANSLKTDDALTVTGIIRGANFNIGNAGGAHWGIVNDALSRADANYAIQQNNTGSTIVGAPTGAIVRLAVNATSKVEVTGTALTLSIPTTVTDTTASTSSTTGALIVAGGVGIAKDSWINSVRIGLGNNALSTNTVLGAGALAGANSGSAANTAIGYQALAANTTGNGNVAIGSGAQSTSTTGAANISVGNTNLSTNNGLYNVAIGHASQDTATSDYNTAVGGLTLRATTGVSNVAIGYKAGQIVSSGYQNTLVGTSSGVATTVAWANTMIGYQAGYHSTGINNIFIGYNSGINVIAGSYNTLVGSTTWPASTTINNNIVLSDGQGNIKYRYDATNVTYTANSGYHSFVSTGSAEQVRIAHTASANRYITLTGSNGGNPTIDVSAGSLAITPAIVAASTISALAITGNSFIPNAATVPTNGMYLEAANNPAFAANSTKIFEYDTTGLQISGTLTTANPGSGAGVWKLGTVVAGAVVLDAANYVEIDIGGAVKKLLIAA